MRPDVNAAYERFVDNGWPEYLGKLRLRLAAETYRAVVEQEARIGARPGSAFFGSHEQLASVGQLERKSVARHLEALHLLGLIRYEKGSGKKGQRRASRIARLVPIPRPGDGVPSTAIRTEDVAPPDIGDMTSPSVGAGS